LPALLLTVARHSYCVFGASPETDTEAVDPLSVETAPALETGHETSSTVFSIGDAELSITDTGVNIYGRTAAFISAVISAAVSTRE
jgi:hypothetical protein